jgi:hypothetical protein
MAFWNWIASFSAINNTTENAVKIPSQMITDNNIEREMFGDFPSGSPTIDDLQSINKRFRRVSIYSAEFLHTQTSSDVAPHALLLKHGTVVISCSMLLSVIICDGIFTAFFGVLFIAGNDAIQFQKAIYWISSVLRWAYSKIENLL